MIPMWHFALLVFDILNELFDQIQPAENLGQNIYFIKFHFLEKHKSFKFNFIDLKIQMY